MKQCQIENNDASRAGDSAVGIPVEFAMDLPLHFPVKVKPFHIMSQSNIPSQKNLIPTLFRIAASAEDAPAPSFRNNLALGQTSLAEMMRDPQRLERILNAATRRKKPVARRVSEKRISFNGDGMEPA